MPTALSNWGSEQPRFVLIRRRGICLLTLYDFFGALQVKGQNTQCTAATMDLENGCTVFVGITPDVWVANIVVHGRDGAPEYEQPRGTTEVKIAGHGKNVAIFNETPRVSGVAAIPACEAFAYAL